MFNPVNYPRFTALLGGLGIPSQESDISFSVRDDGAGLAWCGTGPPRPATAS